MPRITGVQSTLRALNKLVEGDVGNVKQGLLKAAHIVLDRARYYCPKDTGALAASGRVLGNAVGGAAARFTVEFGGVGIPGQEDVTYAAFVHEMLDIPHDPPTCAKFLLKAIQETQKQQVDAVNRAIQIRNMHTTEIIKGTAINYRWTEYAEFTFSGAA